MLTESEVLDEQVQTLETALDKLEDYDNNPVVENTSSDTDIASQLTVTVECLHATADLYRTIQREGVSASDVSALRHIRERMSPFMKFPSNVALEAYEGTFTPSRSMINQTVSQEAAVEEFGKTLKEWFFKIVDWIIKAVDWCRVVWNSESAIRTRLKLIDFNLQGMYNEFDDLIKRNALAGRDVTGELNAISKLVLSDPKLIRSESTLIAFGDKALGGKITAYDKHIDRIYGMLIRDVGSLKAHIENNKPSALPAIYSQELQMDAEGLEALAVASSDTSKDFFEERLGLDYWKKPEVIVKRPVYAPSGNIIQVQKIAKEFRDIRRNVNFDQLKEIDTIVQNVENITASLKALERIIDFKQKLYLDYYKASATLANFYIRGHEMMLDLIIRNTDADTNRVVVEKLKKAWQDVMTRMKI